MKTKSDDSDWKEGQTEMLKRIDLTRDYQKHKEEYLKAIEAVCEETAF